MPGFGDVQFKISAQPSAKTGLSVFGLAGRESMTRYDLEVDGREVVTAQFAGVSRLGVMNLSWTPPLDWLRRPRSRLRARCTQSRSLPVLRMPPYKRDVSVDDFAARQRAVFALSRHHVLDAGFETHRIGSSWQMSGLKPPSSSAVWGRARGARASTTASVPWIRESGGRKSAPGFKIAFRLARTGWQSLVSGSIGTPLLANRRGSHAFDSPAGSVTPSSGLVRLCRRKRRRARA